MGNLPRIEEGNAVNAWPQLKVLELGQKLTFSQSDSFKFVMKP